VRRREAAPAAGPDATYAVRGEIVRLPAEGSREIWIRHEPIPDFKERGPAKWSAWTR